MNVEPTLITSTMATTCRDKMALVTMSVAKEVLRSQHEVVGLIPHHEAHGKGMGKRASCPAEVIDTRPRQTLFTAHDIIQQR
jgi:hypothetical protein